MKKALILGIIAMLLFGTTVVFAGWSGYNYKARIFVGTGMQWCEQKYGPPAPQWCIDYLGSYINDKITMKWNAEWDRGNVEGWLNPPYGAWENNEWNGMCDGCSGAVWHYKIKWVGLPCDETNPNWASGGYCLWGQFEVLMDQGVDPAYGPGHLWFALATPNGYGA